MIKCRYALVLAITVAACHVAEDSTTADPDITTGRFGPAAHGLRMSAEPLRKTVPTKGPLWVEVTVRNVADSVVRFRPIFNVGGWLEAEITGPTGRVPKTASVDPPNVWVVSLQPGESVTDTTDLRCDVPEPTRDGCMAPYDLSYPGEYVITLHFAVPCEIGHCDNLATVQTEPFAVQILQDGG
jgi:hypothetical protein